MELNEKLKIDTSKVAILPYDPKDLRDKNWIHFGDNKVNSELTNDDLRKIDETAEIVISNQIIKLKKYYEPIRKEDPDYYYRQTNHVINLNNYKRQYVAVINEKGEKEVWVNLFCDDIEIHHWKTEIFGAHGGGWCFFQFKLNLTRNKYYDAWFNAEA